MLRSRLVPPLVGSLLCVGCLCGREPVPPTVPSPVEIQPLTLAAALQRTLARNMDLVAAQAQVDVAEGQLRSVREFPNPVLNLSIARINLAATGNRTAKGNGVWDRSYDSIVVVNQLLEMGKRGPRRDSARAGYRAAQAQRDDVRRLLIKTVTGAYIGALEAKEESRILTDSASSLRREAELSDRRLIAGDIAASDKAQIEITATGRELDAAAAEQARTVAIVVLEALLGDPAPTGRTPLVDSLSALSLHPLGTVGVEVTRTRSDIAAAEAVLAKTENDLIAQRRQSIPDLTLGVQFEHNPPDLSDTVGFTMGLPLPLWNRNSGGIRSARAARVQAKAQLEKVQAQASTEVVTARLAYGEARARADRYYTELVAKSADVVRAVRYSYEHGGATLIELLTAERSDNDIRLAAAHAEADVASAASALAAALDQNDGPNVASPSP